MYNVTCAVKTVDRIPLRPISVTKALCKVFKGKALVIEEHEGVVIRTVDTSYPAPKVIVNKDYVHLPAHFYGPAILSQRNLKKRDKETCQYCGRKKHELKKKEFFSRDHIIPQARNGANSWEYVVLSCNTCNNRKGNRTPEEANMKLLREPKAPTRWQL